jgi:hypothetical protein
MEINKTGAIVKNNPEKYGAIVKICISEPAFS